MRHEIVSALSQHPGRKASARPVTKLAGNFDPRVHNEDSAQKALIGHEGENKDKMHTKSPLKPLHKYTLANAHLKITPFKFNILALSERR
jgi:hypothetical protein